MLRRAYISVTATLGPLAFAGCAGSEPLALEYESPDEYIVDFSLDSGTTLDPPSLTVSPGARLAHYTDYLLLVADSDQIEWEAVDDGPVEFDLEAHDSYPANYTLDFIDGGSVSLETHSGGELVTALEITIEKAA